MEKIWYLREKHHHLGPYSLQELTDKLHQGEISQDGPIWREGLEDWGPLKERLPVDSPTPPPTQAPPQLTPPSPSRKSPLRALAWIFPMALIVGLGAIFAPPSKIKIPSLKALSKAHRREFIQVITGPSTPLKLKLAMGRKGFVWFVANHPGPGHIDLTLTSVDKKVLSKESIVLKAQGPFERFVGKIPELKLHRGSSFAPGLYRARGTLTSQDLGPVAVEANLLYSSQRGELFERGLEEFWKQEEFKAKTKLIEELQKWRSLASVARQTFDLYRSSLENGGPMGPATRRNFLRHYNQKIEPLFRGPTVETLGLLGAPEGLSQARRLRLEELAQAQKHFGEMVAQKSDSLARYRGRSVAVKKILLKKASKSYRDFKKHGHAQMDLLHQLITDLKSMGLAP